MTVAPSNAPALDITCTTCGADVVVQAGLRTTECPYCGSPHVVERPPHEDRPDPTFVVAFTVDHAAAQGIVKRWIGNRGPFVQAGIKHAVVEGTRGVYVPSYLYGARAHARYSASIGENYTVTVTYTTTDSKGNTVVRTRTEVRTEWRSLSGVYDANVMDVLVTASRGLGNAELEAVEPFDLRLLQCYTPDLLAGWIAEEASIAPEDCVKMAQGETRAGIERELQGFMPGDSSTSLQTKISLRDEVAHLALLPVWIFVLRYAEDKDPIRILINGQSGKVAGNVPFSAVRIALAVILFLGLAAGLMLVLGVFA
jgi:hypothetical protein